MRQKNTTVATLKLFEAWLRKAQPGDVVMYHIGENCARSPCREAVHKAASDGLVFAYQVKAGPFKFHYYARRLTEKAGKKLKPYPLEKHMESGGDYYQSKIRKNKYLPDS